MENYTGNMSAFLSDRRFFDAKNFPNLFHRSGDFTIKEADVLTATGYIMTLLCEGTMQPQCPEHDHFLDVVNGKQTATSLEEKTYLKYLQLIQEKEKYFPPVKNNVSKVPYIEESYENSLVGGEELLT